MNPQKRTHLDCVITSGAIQKGVPAKVLRFPFVSVSCAAAPKSASFTRPEDETRMFRACLGWVGVCFM